MRCCVVVALIGLLVSCGGGATPTASPAPTDDAGRARLLVLTSADLPDGWHASPHRADPLFDREEKNVARCIGAPDPTSTVSAVVFGDEFAQGAQTISSSAVFFRTALEARRTFAALRSPRAIACVRSSARPVVEEGIKRAGISAAIRSIVVTRKLVAEGSVSAFRIVVTLAARGANLTVQQDMIILGRGRAEVHATFVDVGVAFPAGLELSIVRTLSGKLSRK